MLEAASEAPPPDTLPPDKRCAILTGLAIALGFALGFALDFACAIAYIIGCPLFILPPRRLQSRVIQSSLGVAAKAL
eukprot:CAMPEP_0205904528 /NCGR_PEP_ID=MMETSP1325-20131115/778_1 /ASSEMBLY_ACC=CAM_ASM_000708 /TAXON_ID=236786 /ORGANISM="Florenciella sp., Strain RCC1007" /LENGTH=76 /DNA_ID=CAMNT_0053270313 /DNA_START=386 /DNA_END=616 /DNA_ORIENTATION=+